MRRIQYGKLVGKSLLQTWKNPSLLAVLVMELFLLLLIATLASMLHVSLAYTTSDKTTLAIYGMAILAGQLLIYALTDGFFKAGFSAMLRNTVQDGSTKIGEFISGGKRYWGRFALLFLAIVLLFFLLSIPASLAQLGSNGLFNMIGALVLVIGVLLVMYLFLWTAPEIVFRDVGVLKAMRRSASLAITRPARQFAILGILILIFLVPSLLFMLPAITNMSFLLTYVWLGVVLELFSYLLFAVATVLSGLFVFHAYKKWSVQGDLA